MLRVPFFLLIIAALLSHAATQPLIGGNNPNSTADLSANMYYCSTCYLTKARQAYCYRLALSKYLLAVCKITGDTACVTSSTNGIQAAFNQLTSTKEPPLPSSVSRTTIVTSVDRQTDQSPTFPGFDDDSLQCDVFSSSFINTEQKGIDSSKQDAEIASEALKEDVKVGLSATFKELQIDVKVADTKVETIFEKVRPSQLFENGIPELPPEPALVRVDRNDENYESSSENNTDTSASLDSGNQLRSARVAPRTFLLADQQSLGMSVMPLVGLSDRMELPFVVRRFSGLPIATRITIRLSASVPLRRVQQVLRILLRRKRSFRIYRSDTFFVRRLSATRYVLYAYFKDEYRRFYNSLRNRYGNRG